MSRSKIARLAVLGATTAAVLGLGTGTASAANFNVANTKFSLGAAALSTTTIGAGTDDAVFVLVNQPLPIGSYTVR